MVQYSSDEIPQLSGRRYLVTGANAGIGFACAVQLCKQGARVLLGCRDEGRGREAQRILQDRYGESSAQLVSLDLSDQQSVRRCAEMVESSPLHGLVNNAGIVRAGGQNSAGEFDLRFATNHLGHFALTGLLLGPLTRTGGRVVTVSSMTYRTIEPNWGLSRTGGIEFKGGYALSKLANLVFALELQRRAERAELNLKSVACHPGAVDTNMIANYVPRLYRIARPLIAWLLNSPSGGALPVLRAITDPDVQGGEFFAPRGLMEWAGGATPVQVRGLHKKMNSAKALWDLSEQATGVNVLSEYQAFI
ncbi:MAG: SDR family NAD(P)-dependent oxidoreductase [Pseudomonadota bacterium]